MNYLARKSARLSHSDGGAKAQWFFVTFQCTFWVLLLIFTGKTAFANPKIYLIRHAAVDLQKPGWGTSKNSAEYKETYNIAGIEAFDPEEVLQKIENHGRLDTIFCSPQHRALETALMLFGENVVLRTDSVLAELDYPVVQVPILQLPVKGWLFVSRVSWMAGINRGEKTGYKNRLEELNVFTDDLVKYARRNGLAVVVAHGMLNRELVKILKAHGWEYCENGKDGYGNLSVNCLEYF
ncbi:MAG TPA: histidine phosphatase family protein [Mariniphaga anaerophila]|uniref:Histidine phosphatase family protein n=1 Tax=Mariniphaga anaerophila TaxID=1484053 RepID=A0A831LQP1_9BACT|nr:histidine phosphatase family protein [Mariniphaga anaerophila]